MFIKAHIEKAGEKRYRFLASTSAIDRQGDSVDQSGWELRNFMKNPVILWAHRYDELPLGKVVELSVTENGLESEVVFAEHQKALEVKQLLDDGMLNAVSVGFIPKEREGNIIKVAELLEISIVPVPANQEALALAYKGLSSELQEDIKKFIDIKEVTTSKKEESDVPEEEEEEESGEEAPEQVEEEVTTEERSFVLSKKQTSSLEDTLKVLKTSVSEIEKLLTLSKVATTDESEAEDEKYVLVSREFVDNLKFHLRHDNKSKESILSALKNL